MALPTDRQFTGQRAETGLGIYDYKARFYSPRLGRFLSADTLVPGVGSQHLSRYMYVTGNPVRYNDPTGHAVACDSDAGLGCGGDSRESILPIILPDGFRIDYTAWILPVVSVDFNVDVTWYIYETDNSMYGFPKIDADICLSGGAAVQVGFGAGASWNTGPIFTNAGNPDEYRGISNNFGATFADDLASQVLAPFLGPFATILGIEVDVGTDWKGTRSIFLGLMSIGEETSVWGSIWQPFALRTYPKNSCKKRRDVVKREAYPIFL